MSDEYSPLESPESPVQTSAGQEDPKPVHQGRGRRRKAPADEEEEDEPAPAIPGPAKRRRGRPRKEPRPEAEPEAERGTAAGSQVAPQPKRRGRPPKSSQADQGASTAGPRASGTRARASKRAPEAVAADASLEKATGKGTHKRLKQLEPPVREHELDVVLGPALPSFTDQWTQEDELALNLNSSTEKAAFARIDHRNQTLLSAWKICIRLFRCSPFSLLSPLRGLCYQQGDAPEEHVLGQRFCKELGRVLTHPFWAGDTNLLAMVLQYTVVCRTEDRRVWHMPPGIADGGVLGQLEVELEASQAPLPCSVHEMHKTIRRSRARKAPCLLSDLMIRISVVTKEKRQPSGHRAGDVVRSGGFDVYGVTTADLMTIRAAIDTLDYFGTPVFASTEASYDAFLAARGTHDLPSGYPELSSFHRQAWFHEQRRMVIRRRRNDQGPQDQDVRERDPFVEPQGQDVLEEVVQGWGPDEEVQADPEADAWLADLMSMEGSESEGTGAEPATMNIDGP